MDGESFLRKKSGKIFTSRPHGKVEKREQRKAWKKRKQERISQKKKREEQRKAQTVEHVEESLQVEDASKQLDQSRASTSRPAAFKPRQLEITRGNVMLAMARKRTLPVTRKELLKPAPPKVQKKAIAARKEKCHSGFRELSRELLVINKSKAVGSGSFGKCYSASYREEFRVAVKIFKTKNSSAKVLEQGDVFKNIKLCESEKVALGTRLIFLCKVTLASFPKCCWLFFADPLSTHPPYH